jgi:hypothetical protein
MAAPSFLHIAQGDTACGLLRQITRSFGVPGDLDCIRDDLSHGPLADGRARMAYMKACCRAFRAEYDPDPTVDDADGQWEALVRRVERMNPDSVVVWHADTAADYVFVRMAAHWLRICDVQIGLVDVPPRGCDHGAAIYTPAQLAEFWTRFRAVSREERESLAAEFSSIQARPEPLRRYDGKALTFLPVDAYDGRILSVIGDDWLPAVRVIADLWAGWKDGRNWPSDIFIASRLAALIETGRVQAQGDRSSIQARRVRLSPDEA